MKVIRQEAAWGAKEAQQEAKAQGSQDVRTEHLVLGLLGDGESVAAKVLARRNINEAKVKSALARVA